MHRLYAKDPLVAIEERIDPPNEPVPLEDGHHEVAKLPLRLGNIDLQPEAEREELLGSSSIGDEIIERREQDGPRTKGPAEEIRVRIPLTVKPDRVDRNRYALLDQLAQGTVPPRRSAVESEPELIEPRDTSRMELPAR